MTDLDQIAASTWNLDDCQCAECQRFNRTPYTQVRLSAEPATYRDTWLLWAAAIVFVAVTHFVVDWLVG